MSEPQHPPVAAAGAGAAASIDEAEVARFAAMAEEWWDARGKFRPLHKMNPVRIGYIRDQVCRRLHRDAASPQPFAGLRVLDIGCGGGLLAEPMARLGASVVGVDAAAKNVHIASLHAAQSELTIDYRHGSAEALAAEGEQFDLVLNMEVVEHVADLQSFLTACGRLLKPGGLMVVSTLNRTLKAYGAAIIGAEYILRWLPRGTHDWQKFIKPHELAQALRRAGLTVRDLSGMIYNPISDRWSIGSDLDINYLALAERPEIN